MLQTKQIVPAALLLAALSGMAATIKNGTNMMHQSRPVMVTGSCTGTDGKVMYRVYYKDTKTYSSEAGVCKIGADDLKPMDNTPVAAPKFTKIEKDSKAWLDAHNTHRSTYKTPALTWADDLQKKAQGYADLLAKEGAKPGNDCKYDHNLYGYSLDKSTYGENIAASFQKDPGVDRTASDIVNDFMKEQPDFDPATGKCKTEKGQPKVCQHFTQVVSQQSSKVGCAQAACSNGGYTTVFYVCNYTAPGNVRQMDGSYKTIYPGAK